MMWAAGSELMTATILSVDVKSSVFFVKIFSKKRER